WSVIGTVAVCSRVRTLPTWSTPSATADTPAKQATMNTKRRTDTVIPPFFDILPKTPPVITKCARIIVSTGCVFHGKEYFQRNLSFPKGLTIVTLGFRYHRAAPATQSAGLVAFAP